MKRPSLTFGLRASVQWKLAGLLAAVVLMALGVTLLTTRLQWQSGELRAQLNRVDSESFLIADELADFLRQLNESLYHYGRSHVSPNVEWFNQTSHELELWISRQKPKLITEREKVLMDQIELAYHDYLKVSKDLLVRLQAAGGASVPIDEYTGLRTESLRIFQLRKSLARAHLMSKEQALSKASDSITRLRGLVMISLAVLFVFALALAVVVYHDMIVPLRVKLVQSEALRERQEKLVSLGVLAAGVAHEIRNPLTAIKGALFIQLKHFQAGSQAYTDAKVVEREILRLERIVDDFLRFARPGDPLLTAMTADAPLRQVQSLLAPELAASKLQLVLEEAPSVPIQADADQLQEVLINLVRNAADASEPSGLIQLRARCDRRRLANNKVSDVVILEVEDHGKGIPADVQKRLFDPFFSTKDNGTGLGLSIAARLVQNHGGVLEYQTAPGHGTRFGIVLPMAEGPLAHRAD
jgi:signal transduction histidine kinase